jgi:serine/threonine protein phosphatase PrpC
MKRHRGLQTLAIAGVLIGVVVYLVHPSLPDLLAALASSVTTLLAPLWDWAVQQAFHVTMAQLVIGAGVAWFVFVLALVLLARSGRSDPQPTQLSEPLPNSTSEPPPNADRSTPYRAPMPTSAPYPTPFAAPRARVPPLPGRSPPPAGDPLGYLEYGDDTPLGNGSNTPAAAAAVSIPSVDQGLSQGFDNPLDQTLDYGLEQGLEHGAQASHGSEARQGRHDVGLRPSRGHVLALTGVSVSGGRPLPYGVFIVAEDAASAYDDNRASQRTIEVLAEQLAPCLANVQAIGAEHLAALLKLATIRASIDLLQLGMRTATDLRAKVTGALIVGEVVYVVNAGDCRTYVYQRGAGLRQVTTDHSVVSCLVETELLQPEALYTHPRRDRVYRSVGDHQGGVEVETIEFGVHAGDLLLLCSPGLWQALRQPQIEAILRAEIDPRSAAQTLAREGASRAGTDDFSVIVVRPLGQWVPAFGIPASQPALP